MILGVGKLENREYVWYVVEATGYFAGSASPLSPDSIPYFLLIDSEWELAFIGPVQYWEGDLGSGKGNYSGLAVQNPMYPHIWYPVQGVESGIWVAFNESGTEFQVLEEGMFIRSSSTDDCGYFPITPRGRCVCQAILCNGKQSARLGRVALDLERLPFARELWGYTDSEFLDRERVIDFSWDTEDVRDTLRFTDQHAPEVIFWLI